jgi:hypothetical protein
MGFRFITACTAMDSNKPANPSPRSARETRGPDLAVMMKHWIALLV